MPFSSWVGFRYELFKLARSASSLVLIAALCAIVFALMEATAAADEAELYVVPE